MTGPRALSLKRQGVLRLPKILAVFALATTLLGAAGVQIALPTPSVIVYPLTVNGSDTDKDAGGKLAVLLATQMAEMGGVIVKPAPPGTVRTDYLEAARKTGSDYYVSGYVTPLGDEVSVVEQLVSTFSGTVVWSNTSQLVTYGDAMGQGVLIRTALLRHAGRALASLDAPSPEPAASPSSASGNNANLNKLTQLFHHQKRESATPQPSGAPVAATASTAPNANPAAPPPPPPLAAARQATPAPRVALAVPTAPPPRPPPAPPVPTPPPTSPPALKPTPIPQRTAVPAAAPVATSAALAAAGTTNAAIALVQTGGDAPDDRRAYATKLLLDTFGKNGTGVVASDENAGVDLAHNLADQAGGVCAKTGAHVVLGATLSTRPDDPQWGPATIATITMTGVDCNGKIVFHNALERNGAGMGDRGWELAVRRAVDASVGAYLHPPQPKKGA